MERIMVDMTNVNHNFQKINNEVWKVRKLHGGQQQRTGMEDRRRHLFFQAGKDLYGLICWRETNRIHRLKTKEKGDKWTSMMYGTQKLKKCSLVLRSFRRVMMVNTHRLRQCWQTSKEEHRVLWVFGSISEGQCRTWGGLGVAKAESLHPEAVMALGITQSSALSL